MKIGILTYHRSHNYGALLQAIALRHILSGMGHEVYYVDYWPDYHWRMYAMFSFRQMLQSGYRGSLRYMYNYLIFYDLRRRRIENFKRFIAEQIEPYCVPYSPAYHFDILIYGSDQIWRKQPTKPKFLNPIYFGVNVLSTFRHISYAASMGNIQLDDDDKQFIRRNLSNFEKMSVREEQLKNVLTELGLRATVTLDPTLLLNKKEWEKLLPVHRLKENKYILYYRLLMDSFNESAMQQLADRFGYELVILDSTPRIRKRNVLSTSSPYDFISLIKYAEVVFTSSYHGLVFSLIFNKTFYASFKTNVGRAMSLLDRLGLQDHLLTTDSIIQTVNKIDFSKVNEKIESLRQNSIDFLSSL